LYARHHDGVFILRIEDTDRTRYQEDALQDLMDGLRWLGLDWDEGPEVGGDHGPYFQSQRLGIYQKHAQKLVDEGHAYKCYCSPERLEEMRKLQQARGQSGYDRRCRTLTARERADYEARGIVPVIRLAVPLESQTSFHDVIRGDTAVENSSLDDLVLLKSDGYPTYHLANVVDDHFMEITHIMRADEWLPSVPKHVLLYHAFGWEIPIYAHLPVILAPTGKGKLSKRHGGVAVHDFRRDGYLPEAMVNFLARVGWAYDDKTEFFTRQELVVKFDLAGVNKSPAAFSYDKLDWMNGAYIRQLGLDDLAERLLPFLTDAGLPADLVTVQRIVPLVQERLKKLAEVVEWTDFFFTAELDYNPQLLIGKKMTAEESLAALSRARETLASLPAFDEETIEPALRALVEETGLKARQLFGVIRVAVTGKKVAPPLFGTLAILGREKVLQRIDKALEIMSEM
jgi:glutamyl-tRNA synthetase